MHWQRRSYSLNTYGRRRPEMSEVHIQSLNLALHVHVYPTTHDMKMSRLLDGLISVHSILDF